VGESKRREALRRKELRAWADDVAERAVYLSDACQRAAFKIVSSRPGYATGSEADDAVSGLAAYLIVPASELAAAEIIADALEGGDAEDEESDGDDPEDDPEPGPMDGAPPPLSLVTGGGPTP